MESLIRLEEALLEDNSEGVKGYLSEIDRKTANEMMVKAGEVFGFPPVEAQRVIWTHRGRLSKIFGYNHESGLRYLTDTYQLQTVKIGSFAVQLRTEIRKTFSLAETDSQATFVTWDTFLVAGMYGQNSEAKKVKVYLLKTERAFRVGMATVDQAKAEWLRYRLASQKVKDEISLMRQIEGIKDSPFKDAAIESLEILTGKIFPKSNQMSLTLIPGGNAS